MLRAPRNHTSIYFNEYLKNPEIWVKFQQLINAKGFTSFNSYANHLITSDLHTNFTKVTGKHHGVKQEKKMDIYEDTNTTVKQKLLSYSDGEVVDLLNMLNDIRNTVIRDLKRRGLRI